MKFVFPSVRANTRLGLDAKDSKGEPLWRAKRDCFTGRMCCLSPNQQRQNIGADIRTLRLKGKGQRVQFFRGTPCVDRSLIYVVNNPS